MLAAAFQACYFTAVSLTTVGLATLVTIGTAPVVVVAVETLRGRARRGSLPVVVLALLGLGLLVGLPTTGRTRSRLPRAPQRPWSPVPPSR